MPECPKCGATADEQAHACPSCGLALADATASFQPVESVPPTAPADSGTEGPVLVVRKGPQPGERFYLDRPVLTVGRDPESDIFLNDMTVSREHARLDFADGVVTVSDAGSLNGTYVNGVCAEKATLANGDVLQIGTFQMLFYGAGSTAR